MPVTLAAEPTTHRTQNPHVVNRLSSRVRDRRGKGNFKLTVRPELLAALSAFVGDARPKAPPPTADNDSADVINTFIKDLSRRPEGPANASDRSSQSAAGDTAKEEAQSLNRRARNATRPGSGRVTTRRSFKLDGGGLPEPWRLCPSVDHSSASCGNKVEAHVAPAAEESTETKPTKKKPISVTMRVVKRPRRAKEAEHGVGQPTPDEALLPPLAPFATPAPPSSMKAHGCWYVDHSTHTPAPAPARSYSTPSTLLKAPGCWYVDHPTEATPSAAKTPRVKRQTSAAPSTQLKAKGCWYMDPETTPRTAARPPLSSSRQARDATGVDATPRDSSAQASRSTRKRKAVNFENAATPTALPRLLQSYDSTGGRSQQQSTRGVLTNLRNTYPAATPAGTAKKAASVWRVEYGEGLSPYSFSPVPLQMDACEAASEDMELDNDEDVGEFTPVEKLSGGGSCGMDGGSGDAEHSKEFRSQCSMHSISPAEGEASEPKTPSAASKRDRRKSIPNERLRRASACALTPGINRAGTKIVNGVRRSSRQTYQPLEYWRNEHKEYARCLSSMPTVVKIATRKPEPTPRRPKPKSSRRVSRANK